MKKLLFSMLLLGLTTTSVKAMEHQANIVQTAMDTEALSVLVEAVVAAELVDVLSSEGPFTVFAPTNQAFLNLGDTLDTVLLPENKDLLTSVLTYHVVPGKFKASDLTDGRVLTTVQGDRIEVDLMEGVKINQSNVVMTDIMTKNGIVHVIDAVLIPAPKTELPVPEKVLGNTVVDIALSDENFSMLVEAVVSQNLAETLSSDGPFTVFAPTNEAFERMPALIKQAVENDPEVLTEILLYHVVSGKLKAKMVLEHHSIDTVGGAPVNPYVDPRSQVAFVNSAQILQTDLMADNGVVHVIDRVLVPQSIKRGLVQKALKAKRQSNMNDSSQMEKSTTRTSARVGNRGIRAPQSQSQFYAPGRYTLRSNWR